MGLLRVKHNTLVVTREGGTQQTAKATIIEGGLTWLDTTHNTPHSKFTGYVPHPLWYNCKGLLDTKDPVIGYRGLVFCTRGWNWWHCVALGSVVPYPRLVCGANDREFFHRKKVYPFKAVHFSYQDGKRSKRKIVHCIVPYGTGSKPRERRTNIKN